MAFKPFKKIVENRHERKMAKIEGKNERVASRTERSLAKSEAKQTAYEQGIDPNAAMWQGVAGIAESAGKTAVGMNQAQFDPRQSRNDQGDRPKPTINEGVGGSPMMLILLLLLGFFIMSKK